MLLLLTGRYSHVVWRLGKRSSRAKEKQNAGTWAIDSRDLFIIRRPRLVQMQWNAKISRENGPPIDWSLSAGQAKKNGDDCDCGHADKSSIAFSEQGGEEQLLGYRVGGPPPAQDFLVAMQDARLEQGEHYCCYGKSPRGGHQRNISIKGETRRTTP